MTQTLLTPTPLACLQVQLAGRVLRLESGGLAADITIDVSDLVNVAGCEIGRRRCDARNPCPACQYAIEQAEGGDHS